MTDPAFLGVENSLCGKIWRGPDAAQTRAADLLGQSTTYPPALCQVMAARGVAPKDAEAFLDPKLRDLMPDPSHLRDMDKATDRLISALETHEKIAIFADYDVDGGASAALLIQWLGQLGRTATLYVPDRIDEGYGPNEAAMSALARDHDLIICVDCGTLSHVPIAAAKGADVVVVDHHLGAETLPPAFAVVNPNRQDEDSPLGALCAAGIVFMLLVSANRALRTKGREGPDLIGFLDLVALATVADVAPLVGLNRAFVRQGLDVMSKRQRPGLVALSDVARLETAPSSYHLGFVLGPRVNAGGRIGKADLGARLLATNDPHEAAALAERLDRLNHERREIEEQVRLKAIEQAESRGLDQPLVWAAGDGWHPGVVGIVASRLKELSNRPSVVIGFEGEDGKGSARSVAHVDLGHAIARLQAEGLIEKGGGHKMAAGLSLTRDQLETAMARLSDLLAAQGAGTQAPVDLRIDALITPKAADVDLIGEVERAGPFGASAPAPRFALAACQITFAKRAGENHLRLSLGGEGGGRLDAIAFRAFDSPLGAALEGHAGQKLHVAGRLEVDHWGGRKKAKLKVEDAAYPV